MPITKEQYQKALDVIHEYLPMQLQRQDTGTGEWQNIGTCVRGQTAAYAQLNLIKKTEPKASLRVLPKNEADKYREGILLGRQLGPEKKSKKIPKGMYMPENL